MSIDNTERMRGIAILLILIDHIGVHLLGIEDPGSRILQWGAFGLAIFLFISGFGLYKSYEKKGIERTWLIRRYFRIWVPYVIVSAVWLILDPNLIGITHSGFDTALVLLGLPLHQTWVTVDFNMWFIPFILALYVIFFFVYRIKSISNLTKFALFTVLSTGLVFLEDELMDRLGHGLSPWGFGYTLFFPIGILLGMYYSKVSEFLNKKGNKKMILYGTVLTMIYALIQSSILYNDVLWGAVFFIMVFFLSLQFRIKSDFLYWVGAISYEIYLIHGPLMYRYDFLLFHRPHYLFLGIYFVIVLALAYALKKGSGVIVKYLNHLLEKDWSSMWKKLSVRLYNYD